MTARTRSVSLFPRALGDTRNSMNSLCVSVCGVIRVITSHFATVTTYRFILEVNTNISNILREFEIVNSFLWRLPTTSIHYCDTDLWNQTTRARKICIENCEVDEVNGCIRISNKQRNDKVVEKRFCRCNSITHHHILFQFWWMAPQPLPHSFACFSNKPLSFPTFHQSRC